MSDLNFTVSIYIDDERGPTLSMQSSGGEIIELRSKDFSSRREIGLRTDLFARAIGYKKSQKPLTVLDGTLGFGRDTRHLLQLSCVVTAIEKDKRIFEFTSALLRSLQSSGGVFPRLLNTDILDFLITAEKFDVVFLDPMFPEKKKSAKSGKESQVLQVLASIWSADDEHKILLAAMAAAKSRVVVKRPAAAPFLAAARPDFSQNGKAVRYDVYLREVPKYSF